MFYTSLKGLVYQSSPETRKNRLHVNPYLIFVLMVVTVKMG